MNLTEKFFAGLDGSSSSLADGPRRAIAANETDYMSLDSRFRMSLETMLSVIDGKLTPADYTPKLVKNGQRPSLPSPHFRAKR